MKENNETIWRNWIKQQLTNGLVVVLVAIVVCCIIVIRRRVFVVMIIVVVIGRSLFVGVVVVSSIVGVVGSVGEDCIG